MKRAMAKQAEAERERRAKIVNAEGEFPAAEKMLRGRGDDEPGANCAATALPANHARDFQRTQHDDIFSSPDRRVRAIH